HPDIRSLSSRAQKLYVLGIGSSKTVPDVPWIRWMRKGAMPNFPSLGRREYLIAAVGGAGLVVFAFLVFVLAEWVGEWVGWRDCPGCKPDEIAKAISDARTALLQIIVGVAGAAALYFTWQNYVLSREGRTSDNFIKAVDQLGNKAVHARTGGAVGVGRLLRTAKAEGDYWPLMDVLTAFVRQSAPVGQTPRAKKAPEELPTIVRRSEFV
ncbi:hypothetical protein, partial [Bradyrhizobium sp.]|uniref:hypothetical protein n=1 Tax=Bradyrhizobium sp. TaxID=376 RepID=UPI0025C0AF2D